MPIPSERPITYIKISFLWALYFLKNEYSLLDALREILKKGGNTSSNAAVVGGLIGAARGMQEIDQKMIDTVLRVDEEIPANDLE
jgi:ADP-ribosyl-[dinitrogen reductase] hydrolase